jgi:hypothetical protein
MSECSAELSTRAKDLMSHWTRGMPPGHVASDQARADFLSALAEIEQLQTSDFRTPLIDKPRVEQALLEYLSANGAAVRPMRWFNDAKSMRDYMVPHDAHPAYSSLKSYLPISFAFDAAWRASEWLSAEPPPAWSLREYYEALDKQGVPDRFVRLIRSLSLPEDARFKVDPSVAKTLSPIPAILRAVASGLFYVKFGVNEVICVARPSLWIEHGRLHRDDGPAVQWLGGESHCFWHGLQIPRWMIEQPDRITPSTIRAERDPGRRRCMIERFGIERLLRQTGAKLVCEDQFGKLWSAEFFFTVVEVENGTAEADGTRQKYLLQVPPSMRSPREAVAWTYGLRSEQYDIAVRS